MTMNKREERERLFIFYLNNHDRDASFDARAKKR